MIVRNDEECAIYFRKVFHHTFFPLHLRRRRSEGKTHFEPESCTSFFPLDKNNDDDGKRKSKQIAEKYHGVSFFIYNNNEGITSAMENGCVRKMYAVE